MADSDAERPRRRGFLALPREVLSQEPDGWFVGEFQTAAIYVALVSAANWEEGRNPLPRQKIKLKPGQLVIGQRKWAKDHGISHRNLRTFLTRLVDLRKIDTHTDTHGTVITIKDYEELYLNLSNDRHTDRHAPDTRPTHARHNHDNADKKDNIDKERAASPPAPPVSAYDLKAANWLRKGILLHNPGAVKVRNANMEKWANTFRLMREQDGLDEHSINLVLLGTFDTDHPTFNHDDQFWCKQILSADNFREKWDKLTANLKNTRPAEGFNP